MSYRREDYCPTTGEPCQSMCETPCGSHQRTVDELAMLVRKLVQQLRKAAPGNDSAGLPEAQRLGRNISSRKFRASFKRLPTPRVHVPRLLWPLHEGQQMSKRARDRGDKRDRWREPINHPEPRH